MKNLFYLVALFWMFSDTFAQSASGDEFDSPWLRIYPAYVKNIYINQDKLPDSHNLRAEQVLVALSKSYKPRSPLLGLRSFVTNRMEYGPGCIVDPSDSGRGDSVCDRLRLKAFEKFSTEVQACKNSEKRYGFFPALFVRIDLTRAQCLYGVNTDIYMGGFLKPTEQIIHNIEIYSRFPNEYEISGDQYVAGQKAYLGLENNKLFACYYYGIPVTYRKRRTNPEEKISDQLRMDMELYRASPVWQYQYLIRTNGFIYYCANGKRLIDEPEKLQAYLSDGTALLSGSVSILRVRLKDGSTEAPSSVKRVSPALTRGRLRDAIGVDIYDKDPETCNPSISGMCPLNALGGWRGSGPVKSDKYFIQGIDNVMQGFFGQHNELVRMRQ